MKIILFATALIFTTGLAAAQVDIDLASKILCPRGGVFYRFDGPVTLAIKGDTGEKAGYVKKAVAEFNGICAGLPTQITLVDEEKDANIIVTFSRSASGSGLRWWWDASHKRCRATITFSSSDGARGGDQNLFFLKRLLEAMDFDPAYNAVIAEGSIWSRSNSNTYPQPYYHAPHPTAKDVALIRYAYERIPSGTPFWKLRQMIRKDFGVGQSR